MSRRLTTVVIALVLIATGSLGLGGAVSAAPASSTAQACSQFNLFSRYLRGTNGQALLSVMQQNCASSNTVTPSTPSSCVVPSVAYATIADAFADTNCTDVDLVHSPINESGIIADHDVNLHGHGNVINGGQSGDSIITVNSGVTLNVDSVRFFGGYSPDGGGAIVNSGTLSVTKSFFDSNSMDASGTPAGVGGAIENLGNATINYSVFTNNNGKFGGAIGNDNSGSLTVMGSIFAKNNASDADGFGGAIEFVSGEIQVQYSVFAFNTTGGAGGALSLHNPGSVAYSVFLGNTAADGGAINYQSQADEGVLTLSTDFFINNSATRNGGAVENNYMPDSNGDPTSIVGDLNVTNSRFQANHATGIGVGIGNGGAIWNSGGFTLTGSQVTGNLTPIYGGGIYTTGSRTFQVTDSSVTGNRAFVAGGGIYNDGATVTLTNATVTGNSPNQCAPTDSVPGC